MPLVTVVIPNWNGVEHLPECLTALDAQTFRDFETIVVDNGSTDGSVSWLAANAPDVTVIARAENGGFSVAVNEGIRASDSPFVALLNNDTLAEPDWLAELMRALAEEPAYSIASSLMLFWGEPELVNAAGDAFRFSTLQAINIGFRGEAGCYRDRARVLGACAGAAIYRREVFDDVGLFDETFFLMHEDTDLNIRALVLGKRCLYVPSSRVLHKHSASIRTMPSSDMQQIRVRNEGFVVGRDLPWILLLAAPFVRAKVLFSRTFKRPMAWGAFRKRLRRVRRENRAWVQGVRLGMSRRSELWPRRRASRSEIVRWLLRGSGPAA